MLDHGGENLKQNEATENIDGGLRDRRQLGECLALVGSVQAARPGGLHNKDQPIFGKIRASQQRRDVPLVPAAPVHDQAAVVKSMQTNPRPGAAAREPGQLVGPRIRQAGQLQDAASNRQRELRADAQADVLCRGAFDADPQPAAA